MSHAVHRVDASIPHHADTGAEHAHAGEHVVRAGDDLESIASLHGVPARAIVDANRHLIVDPARPLVVGDNLRIPAADAHAAASSHYKQTVALPRAGHAAPPQSQRLQEIVAHLSGYMRPHHADLGNRNRIVHVRGPDAGKEIEFPIRTGVAMLDGNGVSRGQLLSDAVKINYGQRKVITPAGGRPATYVYVIGASVRENGHTLSASGWVPLSALKDSSAKRHYQADLAAVVAHGPHGGDAPEAYTIDGGVSKLAHYGDLKVNPGPHGAGVPRHERLAASDYLERPGHAVNLLYSLPGHGGASTDTFKTGNPFVPSAGVPRASVPLYLPAHATAAERAAWRDGTLPHTMDFVYGRVGDRYGWIAADALKPAP
jgi:hypothetical protein